MTQKQIAFALVNRDWLNSGVHFLLNDGKRSTSTAPTHLIIGDLESSSDPVGLWLSGVKTTQLTDDGSPVAMRLLIPWSAILTVGIADADRTKLKPGFAIGE
jgi:hypothetical protein